MNLILIIHHLVPGANYVGNIAEPQIEALFGGNEKAAYEAIVWMDERPQPAWNEIVAAWPAVQAAIGREQAKADLDASDSGMIRAVEDLVDVLVAKGVIALADLPQKVREKLAGRKALREIIE